MERHDSSKAMDTLKKAFETVSFNKKRNDTMYTQLCGQEKDIRKLRSECSQRMKDARKKEKQRARAMFAGIEEEKKDPEKKEISARQVSPPLPQNLSKPNSKPRNSIFTVNDDNILSKSKGEKREPSSKEVASKGRTVNGSVEGNKDDHLSSFFVEHREALCIVTGIAMGWLLVNMASKKR